MSDDAEAGMIGIAGEIGRLATPLEAIADLDPLLERIGDARVVLLGEATHGTHEFYAWRELLTRRLVAEKGFSFVAVEGDWPDCDRVDRCVRGLPGARDDPADALRHIERWPTWMWANDEVLAFARWLRDHNRGRPRGQRAGFHGLDVYSLWESLHQLVDYLREHDPDLVPAALEAYHCFEPYGEEPQDYALATRFVPTSCEEEVVDLLVGLRRRAAQDGGGRFGAWQNAEVVAGAERFYRAMVRGGGESWNVRDRHMDETLSRLLEHYEHEHEHEAGAKAVVWAHNTHVGDARATDMAAAGEVNIGQLARERYGAEHVVLVGFGTYRGTVIAGSSWGATPEAMRVPPARPGSLEAALHEEAPPQALLVFGDDRSGSLLAEKRDHRAVGVVYRPESERWGNYVPTVLGERYDAFVWLDRTRALEPLRVEHVDMREEATSFSGT